MNLTTVRYGVDSGVATLTLDRPEARNAVNRAMCDDIVAATAAARDDAEVRLVLIRATGPVFCAGADLKERKGMASDEVRARRLAAYAAYGAIESLPMPAIAIVHGAAVGSGCDIAACCDFVVATPQATFATPEALWGTVGATQRLPRILGKQLAKDMMFTGRKLGAEEARTAGRRSGPRPTASRMGADHSRRCRSYSPVREASEASVRPMAPVRRKLTKSLACTNQRADR